MNKIDIFDLWAIAIWAVAMFGKISPGWIIAPYIIKFFWSVLETYNKLYGVEERIKFFVFKIFVKNKVKAASKKAAQQYTPGNNPGSFINRDENPKGR